MLAEYDLSRSINLLSLIVIIGSFEGIFISIFLFLKRSVKSKANFWLGILVLAVTLIILPGAVYRIGLLPNLPHVVHLHMVTTMIMGPSAYLYVRSCTQKGFKMKPILWLHFLPALLALIYHFPFFMASGEEKVISFFKYFLEGDLSVPRYVSLIKVMHSFIYFIICFQLVRKYRKHLSNAASYIDVTFHQWLLLFCLVLLAPILSATIYVFTSFQLFSATTLQLGLFVFILGVHIAAMVKPSLFHVFPHQMPIPESTEEKKQKYENSNLQEKQKEKYLDKLQTFVAKEQPFIAPELTIAQLSEQINIPAHYLSQIINEKLGINFLDFINSYRVQLAQEMLVNPKYNHYTIISIAYEAGFNSKSTFYTAFKKATGITPSKYRKQMAMA